MSTNVRNGLGQFSISEPNTMIEGELSAGLDHDNRSAINPLEAQTFTVTIGDGDGDGDGDIDIDITGGRDGSDLTINYDGTGEVETAIAAGLAAAWDPSLDVAALVKSVSAAGAVVTVELNPNPLDLDVSATVNSGSYTATVAETTAGAAIPFGRFVVLTNGAAAIGIGAQECGLPGASSVAADVLGIAVRDRTGIARGESSSSSAVDQYAMGDAVAYCRKGIVAMRVQGASAATAGGQVYFGKPAAGVAGGAYSTTASGNAVSLPGCRFLTAAAAGELVYVEINLPQ